MKPFDPRRVPPPEPSERPPDQRWPDAFLVLATRYGERMANTSDGSAYFKMSRPHSNVWFNPNSGRWRVQDAAGAEIYGVSFLHLERILGSRRAKFEERERLKKL